MYYTKSYKIGVYVLIKFNLVEKDILKNFFYYKIILTFSSLKKQEEKVSKKKKLSLFSTLLRALNKMDVAGEPALSRSLKNARGANVVQYFFIEHDRIA